MLASTSAASTSAASTSAASTSAASISAAVDQNKVQAGEIEDDVCELHLLAEILQMGYGLSIYNFEANYVDSFSDEVFPGEKYVAKELLKQIMQIHATYRHDIQARVISRNSIEYCYTYKNNKRMIKLHNDMELHEDMLMIIYINMILTSFAYEQSIIKKLNIMLSMKYDIQKGFCSSFQPVRYQDNKIPITVYRIIHLFPSISISLGYRNHKYLTTYMKVNDILSSVLQVPKVMYNHMFFLVLPRSVQNPPIPLILYILLQEIETVKLYGKKEMTKSLIDKVKNYYKKIVFPEELCIRLCVSWNIMEQAPDGTYLYTQTILNANQDAKNVLMRKTKRYWHLLNNVLDIS